MRRLPALSLGLCSAVSSSQAGVRLPGLDVPAPVRWSPPAGFPWSPSWAVIETAPGVFTTNIEPTSLKLSTATTRYVDIATGSDANTGLVAGSPKKSIWSAMNVGANDTIYVKGSADPANPTVYHYDWSWRLVPVQNTNVIVVSDFTTLAPGWAVSSIGLKAGDSLLGTWALTADGAGPHVYEATLAVAPYAVVDAAAALASSGALAALTLRASIATVEANPGSYWHDSGKLYVRTADSRAPDAALRPLKTAINGWLNTAISLYVERMTFEGGNAGCFFIQHCATASFVDCRFINGQQQGCELNIGAGVTGTTHTVHLIRCKALGNAGDGLGATALGADETVRWLEWGCEAVGNSGPASDQGSSLHLTAGNTAIVGIRVGCTTHHNKSQGFADVGGTAVWMVGCRSHDEVVGGYVGDTGTTWLQGCVFTGNTTDLSPADAGATFKVVDVVYQSSSGSGSIARYQP